MPPSSPAHRFAKAVKQSYPHVSIKVKANEHHSAAHVSTRSDYFTEIQQVASHTGMKFKYKSAGNDATGEATYVFVPKES